MKKEEKLKYLKPLETYFLHNWVREYWWTIIISVNPTTVLTFETDDDNVNYEIGLLKKFPGLSGELAASKRNMQKATVEQCESLIKTIFDPKSKLTNGLTG